MPGLNDVQTLVPGGAVVANAWAVPVVVTDPAAGVPTVTRTVDGAFWERVRWARATFTADATVGTRNPRLEFVDQAGNVFYAAPISTGIVASTAVTVSFAIDGPSRLGAAGVNVERLPDNTLEAGWAVRFAADSIGAADAWTGVRFYVVRYPTNTTVIGSGG